MYVWRILLKYKAQKFPTWRCLSSPDYSGSLPQPYWKELYLNSPTLTGTLGAFSAIGILMASSSCSNLSCCLRSVPKFLTASTLCTSFLCISNNLGYNGISLQKTTRIHAKFKKFQGQKSVNEVTVQASPLDPEAEMMEVEEEEEDDRWVFNFGVLFILMNYMNAL